MGTRAEQHSHSAPRLAHTPESAARARMLTRPRTVAGHKGASPSRRPRGSRPSSAAGSSGVPKQLFTPGADDEQVLREGAAAAESLFSHRLMHSLGDHSTTREGRSPASSVVDRRKPRRVKVSLSRAGI